MARKSTKPPTPIAAWVERVRVASALSQEAFAERIGKHRISVHDWEKGASVPDVSSLQAIGRAFPSAPPPPGFSQAARPDASARTQDELRALGHAELAKMAGALSGVEVAALAKEIDTLVTRWPSGEAVGAGALRTILELALELMRARAGSGKGKK